MRLILLALSLISTLAGLNSQANIRGELTTENFKLTSLQPKLICRYETPRGAAVAEQEMPEQVLRAFVSRTRKRAHYKLELEGAPLSFQADPRLELKSCSYSLFVSGIRTKSREEIHSSIDLIGSALSDMSAAELESFANGATLESQLQRRIQNLSLRWNLAAGRIEARNRRCRK